MENKSDSTYSCRFKSAVHGAVLRPELQCQRLQDNRHTLFTQVHTAH